MYEKEWMLRTNQNWFIEEVNIIKHLDHPNIFKIYEFFLDDYNYYLVTEFLEGGELFTYISQQKSFNEKDAFLIME